MQLCLQVAAVGPVKLFPAVRLVERLTTSKHLNMSGHSMRWLLLFTLQEDPKPLLKAPLPDGKCLQRLAWGPNDVIAGSIDNTVYFISSKTGKVLDSIHAHDGQVVGLCWAPRLLQAVAGQPPQAVLTTCSTDRRVRLWRSPQLLE